MGCALREGVELAMRSFALPWVLGLRWIDQRAKPDEPHVPRPPWNLALAAKIAADEFFFATEVLTSTFVTARDRSRIAREVAKADTLYREQGWLDDPARYHPSPPPLTEVRLGNGQTRRLGYAHLSWESGYAPHPGEPGRGRWLRYGPNRIAHAWLLRHAGAPRPWVVCVPGYRMGHPAVDFVGFRTAWLHRALGLNVAIPVLPFHGPRRVGSRGGDGYLTGDFLDTIHAQAQSVWDVRRLVGWLRREESTSVGLYGLSLGGYTSAFLASLDARFDCVIAGIPAADFLSLVRWNAPALLIRVSERLGFPWKTVERLLQVISPLALAPRVSRERCYLFAGSADRLSPPRQVRKLWRHWGCPRLVWYPGTHVSFGLEREVKALVREALETTGLVGRRRSESPAGRATRFSRSEQAARILPFALPRPSVSPTGD